MSRGRRHDTVVLFAYNDLADKVQPGDRVHITGEGLHPVRPLTWLGADDPMLSQCQPLTSNVPSQTAGCLVVRITSERL